MRKKLEEKYQYAKSEKFWQEFWNKSSLYKWNENESRENSFIIDTPPPTVSGMLHMGHVFSYTQADFIARFQRMNGKNVFYPIGFDDNGLPTERLVEKNRKIRANKLDRQEFINICYEVLEESEKEFENLFKSIALSVDWDQKFQTISNRSRTISQLSFLDLYHKGRIYRKIQPCLWDVVDRTALAQAEIEDIELSSHMNEIIFLTEEGKELVIATTRPELIAACVAILYNPKDDRYKGLNGNAITPLFNVTVPILQDEAVDLSKGTGIVMCCTFGDQTDIDWWKKYDLPTRVIISQDGRLINMEEIGSDKWPSLDISNTRKYVSILSGLKIKDARDKIIELLEENNKLVFRKEIMHIVKCAERSKSPLEILVTPQWFIKVLDIKDELLRKSSECNWHPTYMKVRMDNWIEGLKWDWCISRQRFFGVPFPIWYSKRKGEEGKVLIADIDQLPIDPLKDLPKNYSKDEVEPDKDIMDTWATSSVSPQLSSLAINKDYAIDYQRHKKLFPADLRPQAHEIIRTWAFGTLVKSYLHENTIPWNNLMISGWVLAADKTKMSKSKGNIVTPVALINEQGADVVRYWASNSKLGSDITYSEEVFKIGRKLINKLWNSSKFVCLHLEKLEGKPSTIINDVKLNIIYEKMDLWLLSKLYKTINKASTEFSKFEYWGAVTAVEDFFWNILCDNYLEIIKVRIYDESSNNKFGAQSAIYCLYHTLLNILKLYAPILPHITEELYNSIYTESSIHAKNTWPKIEDFFSDNIIEEQGDALVNILIAVRKFKSEKLISIKTPIEKILIASGTGNIEKLYDVKKDLMNVTNASNIEFVKRSENMTPTDGEIYFVEIKL